MSNTQYAIYAAAVALVFAANTAPAETAQATKATTAAAKPAAAAPTLEALMTLEKNSYEAWRTKDAKFWNTYLWNKFVGYGSSGKLNKASATKEYTSPDCIIKSYALSDAQIKQLGNNAALITYKNTIDGACSGQKLPGVTWAASVYVRDGDTWKAAFFAEDAVVDPKAAAKPADKKEAPKKVPAKANATDAGTTALLPLEKALWDAWREHDGKKIASLTAAEISFINIFGSYFPTKADALKDWTSPGCDVKSTSVTEATATMLSPTAGILTFNGAADGTCFGQKVGPIWGTSIYVKDSTGWKWTFGINVPAGH
jgi:hypothetical protein